MGVLAPDSWREAWRPGAFSGQRQGWKTPKRTVWQCIASMCVVALVGVHCWEISLGLADRFRHFSLPSIFAPHFRSQEWKFPGTLVPGSECSREHSFRKAIYRGANCTSNYKLHITHKPTLKPIYTTDSVYSLEFESTGHCSKCVLLMRCSSTLTLFDAVLTTKR